MRSPRALATVCRAAAICCLAGACVSRVFEPTIVLDRASLFDEVWQQFDLHYSFFELKHVNWDSLGTHYRPLAVTAQSDYQFALVVSHMLAELEDVHVSLSPAGPGSTIRYLSRADTIPTHFNEPLIFQRYVPESRLTSQGHLRYGMLAPTVGYVSIRNFDGLGWANEMDAAIRGLPAATHLVVDVRNNLGGTYSLAAEIAGRFADGKRTFGYVRRRNGRNHDDFTGFTAETVQPAGAAHFGGPVFVLSNRRDFSTAEDFILAMRSFPNVTIVGDTTAGASGGPIVREMANGWTFQLSEWIEYTPAQRVFEGIGLAPNVFVEATDADAQRGVDAILERALALTLKSPTALEHTALPHPILPTDSSGQIAGRTLGVR